MNGVSDLQIIKLILSWLRNDGDLELLTEAWADYLLLIFRKNQKTTDTELKLIATTEKNEEKGALIMRSEAIIFAWSREAVWQKDTQIISVFIEDLLRAGAVAVQTYGMG